MSQVITVVRDPAGIVIGYATLAHQFVRLLGGDIEVESTPGQGATFRFSIGIQVPKHPPLAPTDTCEVIGLAPGTPSPKVLIVQDREPNRLVLIHLLGPLGFTLRGRRHLKCGKPGTPT